MRLTRLKPGWSTATKLATAAISTAAALVSILSYFHSWGFLGDQAGMRMTLADLAVDRIELVPEADTVTAIGDTVHLAVRVLDAHGTALLGATPRWASANPEIASVDGSGTVIARAAGTGVILASVGVHIARARITVSPRVAHVHLVLDSALHLREGATMPLVARALDAHGYVIPGRPITWQVTDTAVATVDTSGLVVAIAPGRAAITATIDGVTSEADLIVAPALGTIGILSGMNQRAPAGTRLPAPILLQVLSRRGQPLAGATIHTAVQAGDGTVDPATAVTDERGRAEVGWTLGPRPGRQELRITADGLDTVLALAADADPVAADTRIVLLGDRPAGRAGQALARDLAVRITDSLGTPLAGLPVAWSTPNGGTITARSARTDSLGEARAQWTLGPRAGSQRAYLQVGSGRTIPPFPISAVALAGEPVALEVVNGDEQRGAVGTTLGDPVIVRVVDRAGNGVLGTTLHIASTSGSVSDSVLTTDSTGHAHVAWTLGRAAGTQHLWVRADGLRRPLEITALARALAAANVAFLAAPSEGTPGRALPQPVRARITDAYGNPVENVLVIFRARSGNVTPTRVMTDAHGIATTRWTLGPKTALQELVASVRGTDVHGTLAVLARPPASTTRQR